MDILQSILTSIQPFLKKPSLHCICCYTIETSQGLTSSPILHAVSPLQSGFILVNSHSNQLTSVAKISSSQVYKNWQFNPLPIAAVISTLTGISHMHTDRGKVIVTVQGCLNEEQSVVMPFFLHTVCWSVNTHFFLLPFHPITSSLSLT